MIVGKENNSILITQGIIYTLNLSSLSVCLSVCTITCIYQLIFFLRVYLEFERQRSSRQQDSGLSSVLDAVYVALQKRCEKEQHHTVSLLWVACWYLIVNRSSMAADASMLQKWAYTHVFYHYSLFSSILPNNYPPMLFIFLLYYASVGGARRRHTVVVVCVCVCLSLPPVSLQRLKGKP